MLSDKAQEKIRDLCRRYKLGMVAFKPNGVIVFSSDRPIKESIERHLPSDFEIMQDSFGDEEVWWADRPDARKLHSYWVEARPNWTHD